MYNDQNAHTSLVRADVWSQSQEPCGHMSQTPLRSERGLGGADWTASLLRPEVLSSTDGCSGTQGEHMPFLVRDSHPPSPAAPTAPGQGSHVAAYPQSPSPCPLSPC